MIYKYRYHVFIDRIKEDGTTDTIHSIHTSTQDVGDYIRIVLNIGWTIEAIIVTVEETLKTENGTSESF